MLLKKLSGIQYGDFVTAKDGAQFKISDWSPATGQVYGWSIDAEGVVNGDYRCIPFSVRKG